MINSNSEVVVHCRAGCHQAALLTALILMFGKGISFDACKEIITAQRPVRIEEIQQPRQRADGSWTENHEQWIREFERIALDADKNTFRFSSAVPPEVECIF